jgi:hypothetical protein
MTLVGDSDIYGGESASTAEWAGEWCGTSQEVTLHVYIIKNYCCQGHRFRFNTSLSPKSYKQGDKLFHLDRLDKIMVEARFK